MQVVAASIGGDSMLVTALRAYFCALDPTLRMNILHRLQDCR